ncbi:hypothetical protein Y1Q_0023794 [Alligator mississippiensis]|uniref:Uncharacterized protein n=1 Tax=Alligator mississippiensis TaxID=8496 RepID=A0A151MKL4_ALLMI|nr:hypothetical protein Y1Q_0023794 [Alligator mississippiensis]
MKMLNKRRTKESTCIALEKVYRLNLNLHPHENGTQLCGQNKRKDLCWPSAKQALLSQHFLPNSEEFRTVFSGVPYTLLFVATLSLEDFGGSCSKDFERTSASLSSLNSWRSHNEQLQLIQKHNMSTLTLTLHDCLTMVFAETDHK